MEAIIRLVIRAGLVATCVGILAVDTNSSPKPSATSFGADKTGPEVHRSAALWVRTYSSPAAMLQDAPVTVVARALKSIPGRVVSSQRHEVTSFFELVQFEIEETLKSEQSVANLSGQILVERLARQTAGTVEWEPDLDGPPPFIQGERYVLFLRRQQAAPFQFIQLNDQARYELTTSDIL